MLEGHRWIDYRRFGLLNTLPIDSSDPLAVPGMTPQIVVSRLPIPAGECRYRANAPTKLQATRRRWVLEIAAGGCDRWGAF